MDPIYLLFIIPTALILLAAVLYLFVLVRPRKRVRPEKELLCPYAHRGLHGNGVPENSLSAFALACEQGVGIELDVQLSRDGVVMVFHDEKLFRMTGSEEKLCELEAAELSSLSLSGTDQTIPTLREVLTLVDGRVPLLVELKGETTDASLCEKLTEQLKSYKGAYCLESFNPLLIGKMKAYLPDAYRGILYTNVCREKKKRSLLNILLTAMALNVLAKPDFVAFNETDRKALPVKITTGLFRADKFVWTVRSEESLATAKKNGECPIFEHVDTKKVAE